MIHFTPTLLVVEPPPSSKQTFSFPLQLSLLVANLGIVRVLLTVASHELNSTIFTTTRATMFHGTFWA